MKRNLKRLRVLLVLLAMVCGSASPGAWLSVQSETQSDQSIAIWSQAYQIDPGYMSRILSCESRFDPAAYNAASGASGVAQWEWPSFLEERAALNNDPSLAPGLSAFDPEYGDLWSVDSAIHVMAHALYVGHAWRWSCA